MAQMLLHLKQEAETRLAVGALGADWVYCYHPRLWVHRTSFETLRPASFNDLHRSRFPHTRTSATQLMLTHGCRQVATLADVPGYVRQTHVSKAGAR
jgi:hypothetical protein